MLKEVIDHINSLLVSSEMVSQAYGLCEIVEKDEKKFPAEYCLGKYIQVSDFDNQRGLCYHRLNGKIQVSQEEDDSGACGILSAKTYPILMLIGVKKELFGNDKNNAYIELSIIENIEALISSQNNGSIATAVSAESISIEVTGSSHDRYSIFKNEYPGSIMKIPFEYAYISLEYEVTIVKKLSCHTQITC